MRLRGATITLFLIAGWVIGGGAAFAAPACTVAAFETEPETTVGACTAALAQSGLSDAERAELMKIRARSLHTTGHLDEAIKDYDAALLLAPDDPELHLRRGWTAYDKDDFALVIDQANAAIKLRPGYAAAYDLIGATLARPEVGRQQEAMAVYREAIRIDPDNPSFHFHLMVVDSCCGMPESALAEAEVLLRLPAALITKPHSVEYYGKKTSYRVDVSLERARFLSLLGRIDEAKQAYDQAVRDDPGALTYACRAAFLLEYMHSSFDEVQADLDKSLAADPNVWYSHGTQGRVFFYRKDYSAAEKELGRSLAIHPTNGFIRWWHAMTLRMLGRTEDAESEAVAAFQVDPDFMFGKVASLEKFGLAPPLSRDTDPRPALYDAARACMIDDKCW